MSSQQQVNQANRSAASEVPSLSDLSAPSRDQFTLPLSDDQAAQPVQMPVLTPDPRLTPRTPPVAGHERPVRMPVKDL